MSSKCLTAERCSATDAHARTDPRSLYAYDLRHSDDGDRFCSIEPKVGVNHGGTVLMRDILDFGESGYIPLDEDTEPNFLGETMTVSEFAEEEAQDETMQMGGM